MPTKISFFYHALRMKFGMAIRHPSNVMFYFRYYFKRLETKDYDVLLVSYPKSGRTWLEQILLQIVRARFDLPEEQLLTYQDVISTYPEYPKVLFTHAGSSWESELNDENDILHVKPENFNIRKCVFLYRDPRDVQVSVYHHIKNRTGIKNLERESMVGDPMVGIRKVVRFMNVWWKYCAEKDKDSFVISYESLRRYPTAKLDTLLSFLNFDATAVEIEFAIKQADFRRMQQKERAGRSTNPWLTATDRSNPNSFKVRSGKIGSFAEFFSAEQQVQMESLLREELDPAFGYGTVDNGSDHPR